MSCSLIKVRGKGELKITGGRGPSGASGGGSADSFETVSQNLDARGASCVYSGELLQSVTYLSGVVKTFNYTGELLTSVVLSGSTPSGIDLTKTFSYTGESLTGIAYS